MEDGKFANERPGNDVRHFRAFPQLLLEGGVACGRQTLLTGLVEAGARRFRSGFCHEISIRLEPDGMTEVGFEGAIPLAAELERLTRNESEGLDFMQFALFRTVAFSSEAKLSFPDERRGRLVVLRFRDGEFVSSETEAAPRKSVLALRYMPDEKIMGNGGCDLKRLRADLRRIAGLNAGLTLTLDKYEYYFSPGGAAELLMEFFPITWPDEIFSWRGETLEFAIARPRDGKPGELRSFAGDRETVDGGLHVDGFKRGMTDALNFGRKKTVPTEKILREWNVVIAAHVDDPIFESGYICRLGGDPGLEPLFWFLTNVMITRHMKRDPDFFERGLGKGKTLWKAKTPKP